MPADLERLHKQLLKFEHIDDVSDEMRMTGTGAQAAADRRSRRTDGRRTASQARVTFIERQVYLIPDLTGLKKALCFGGFLRGIREQRKYRLVSRAWYPCNTGH